MNTRNLNRFGFLAELMCAFLRIFLVVYTFRHLCARGKVTIVQYHDPKPEVFRRHMDAFSRKYLFIDIDTLAEALDRKDLSGLPPRSMLVTLDDGYRTNADLLEIIRAYQIPVVIYAVAGLVGTNRHFWFKTPSCSQPEIRKLKNCQDRERRAILKQRGHYDKREYEERQSLSSIEVRKLLAIDGVVIGSHTMSHPQLTMCSNEVGLRECLESRKTLEDITQGPVLHFAYPDGDSDKRVHAWVRSAGYRTARAASFGWVTAESDALKLPCIAISDDADVNKALVQASGLWGIVKCLVGLRPSGKVRQNWKNEQTNLRTAALDSDVQEKQRVQESH
ncbi:MAG: polysaccharide deacetylase family protein [Planctomycetota bacterium]|nr:polysaccharide deacetylase family protein [Planctomycetota bacterium]